MQLKSIWNKNESSRKFDAERWKFGPMRCCWRYEEKNAELLLFWSSSMYFAVMKSNNFFRGCKSDEYLTRAGALCDVGICLCVWTLSPSFALSSFLFLYLTSSFYLCTSQIYTNRISCFGVCSVHTCHIAIVHYRFMEKQYKHNWCLYKLAWNILLYIHICIRLRYVNRNR